LEASLGKWFLRPYLEKNHHTKGLVEWLEFKPQYHKKKKKKEEEEEKRIGRTEWCNACEVLVAEHTTQGSNGERTDLNGSTAS
jgi:hypothetical protein